MRFYFVWLACKTRTKNWISHRYALFITFCIYLGILSFIWLFIGRLLLFVLLPQSLNVELASQYLLPLLLGAAVCLPFTGKILNALNGFWSWLTDTSWLDEVAAEGEAIYWQQREEKERKKGGDKDSPKPQTPVEEGVLIRGVQSAQTVYFKGAAKGK